MVEFSGEFSETSKNYLLKENAFIGLLAGITILIVFGTITLVIAAVYNLWIITWFLIFFVIVAVLAPASPYFQKNKTLRMLIPKKISIDYENIYYDLEKASLSKPLTSIKIVVDYGDWYLLKLGFPKIGGYLCQKDLIKQGSIEEFERLFEGKIIRQVKN